MFGEKHNGKIEQTWKNVSKKIGTTEIEAKEVYRIWRENQQKKVAILETGNEDAWNDLFEKKITSAHQNTSWEQFAKENGLVGAGLSLAALFLVWKKRREAEEAEDTSGEEYGMFNNIWDNREENNWNSSYKNAMKAINIKRDADIKSMTLSSGLKAPEKPVKNSDVLAYENLNKHFQSLPQAVQESAPKISSNIYRLQRLTEESKNYIYLAQGNIQIFRTISILIPRFQRGAVFCFSHFYNFSIF